MCFLCYFVCIMCFGVYYVCGPSCQIKLDDDDDDCTPKIKNTSSTEKNKTESTAHVPRDAWLCGRW